MNLEESRKQHKEIALIFHRRNQKMNLKNSENWNFGIWKICDFYKIFNIFLGGTSQISAKISEKSETGTGVEILWNFKFKKMHSGSHFLFFRDLSRIWNKIPHNPKQTTLNTRNQTP